MIKVDVVKEDGKLVLFFESSKPNEETELLDDILLALCDTLPRRGSYVLGAPNLTLKIEIKNESIP